jgi:outer membrane protein assembly factor BamB
MSFSPRNGGTLGSVFALQLAGLMVPYFSFAQSPGTKLWEATVGNHVYSSPALNADGTIYVGVSSGDYSASSSNGWVYALSPAGTTKWVVKTFGDVRTSPAIGSDGTIYVASFYGIVYAFSSTGKTNWSLNTSGLYRSYIAASPAIGVDGNIYLYLFSGYDPRFGYRDNLYSIRPNGTTNWFISLNRSPSSSSQEPSIVIFASPTIGPDGTIYVSTRDRKLFAISPAGTTNWVFSLPASTQQFSSFPFSSPAVDPNGTVYLGNDDDKFYAIDRWGRKKWEFLTGGAVESSPVLGRDTVYFGSLDRNLYALDFEGHLRWKLTLDEISDAAALGADQSLYMVSVASQKLYAVDATHSNSWSFPFPGFIEFASPALDTNGVIYFGGGGKVYAVRGSAGLAESSWPMHRRNPSHTGRATQRRMERPKIRVDGAFGMDLVVEPAESYDVQYSTNLVDWNTLTNFQSATYTNQFIDSEWTKAASRFYRLSSPAR